MGYLDRVKQSSGMSRRGFVKASAAATAALATGASLVGCAPKKEAKGATEAHEVPARDITSGEWKPAACWHNCGGKCLNKVLVQDGVVVRQKTDDTHEDSPDYPQQRSCLRGRAQRNHVFAADRLKYPMKRKSWQPGGGENAHGELRGKDEWERVSWDEAMDYIADEIKRIVAEHGNEALFADGLQALNIRPAAVTRMLALYGGYVEHWGTTSLGTWTYTPGVVGIAQSPQTGMNDRLDMLNCDVLLMFGSNPAWASMGNPPWFLDQVRKAGAKIVGIDPFYNDSYNMADAEWIPCRPSTDVVLYLGMANAMLEMDDEKHLIDWDYLDRCTIGFDADHMPEGEDPKGNFKDYVLGTYDGMPKTPEWASKICGVSPENIRHLAELNSKDNKVAIFMGWASARTHNADCVPQIIMTIGAMGGHYGKPGHMCGTSGHSNALNGGTYLIGAGKDGLPAVKNPLGETNTINDTEMWNAIADGAYTFGGNGSKKVPGEKRTVDIKMIYHDGQCNKLQTTDGLLKGIEAHRKVDLVVSHALSMNTIATYSDFVLPLASYWEREGGFLQGNREALVYHTKIIEPMFECKQDEEIAVMLGERLGVDMAQAMPFGVKQQVFNQLAGAFYTEEVGGDPQPLLTITQADIDEWECEGAPQEGVIGIKEFIEQGVFQLPRKKGDRYGFIAYEKFVEDPEANPVATESGKQEIYSKKLRDTINAIGYSTIEAIPTYIPQEEGYEATLKGEFPFQLYTPHYLRRSHSTLDNVQWLREAWVDPVFINAEDGKEQGLETGDTVLITSPHGKTLRKATLTNRIMPGVVGLPHGAWVSLDEKTGIDRAGADNVLSGQIQSGQGTSGWNTCICKIEKYGEEIPDDIDVPQRILAVQE